MSGGRQTAAHPGRKPPALEVAEDLLAGGLGVKHLVSRPTGSLAVRDEEARRVDEIARLEAELSARCRELGELRLQLDVFSTIDPITGLLNRHGILDAVDTAAGHLSRAGDPLGLLLVTMPGLEETRRVEGEGAYCERFRDAAVLVAALLRDTDRVGRVDDVSLLAVLPWTGSDELPLFRARLAGMLGAHDASLGASFTSLVAGSPGSVDSERLEAVLGGIGSLGGWNPASAGNGR